MARRPLRPLFLLSAAALAPITLGLVMHLDHVAAAQACTADLATWAQVPSATPADPVAPQLRPQTMPIPVPVVAPATEHALPFAFVVDVAGPHIVLATDVEDSWARGKPQLVPSEYPSSDPSVLRDVALDRIPAALRASIGRTVRVYSAEGEACTAQVGAPVLLGEVWGELEWDEADFEGGEPKPKPADPERTWEQGRRTLVAPLVTDGECGSPLWARDLALPAPAVFTRTDGPVPRAARKAVMRSAEVREFAREFRGSFEAPAADEAARVVPSLAERAVGQRWHDARGRELFTITFTGDEFGGCGGADPAWAAFVPTNAEGVTALDRVGDDVLAVVDLDRDGTVEVLTTTWLGPTRLVEVGGSHALTQRASLDGVPFFGCPC